MEIYIQSTGAVVTEHEFRAMHPNTSFPAVLTLDILADFGADPVLEAPAPDVDNLHQAVRNGVVQDIKGNWVYAWTVIDKPYVPPTVKEYTDAVQAHLDSKAQAKNYDNIVSACSYAGAPNPFQAEGIAFVTWRGAVWSKCYEVMAAVQAGDRQPPTIQELLDELPVLA